MASVIPYSKFPKGYLIIYTVLPIVDVVVQFLICYICWTVGASDHFKRFDCILIEDGQGGYIVKYKLKEGVPTALGEAYAASIKSDGSSLIEQESHSENSFIREWRNRNSVGSINN